MGSEEIKDFSGTGLRLCRFEFINERGEVLVVAARTQEHGERIVWAWFIDDPKICEAGD